MLLLLPVNSYFCYLSIMLLLLHVTIVTFLHIPIVIFVTHQYCYFCYILLLLLLLHITIITFDIYQYYFICYISVAMILLHSDALTFTTYQHFYLISAAVTFATDQQCYLCYRSAPRDFTKCKFWLATWMLPLLRQVLHEMATSVPCDFATWVLRLATYQLCTLLHCVTPCYFDSIVTVHQGVSSVITCSFFCTLWLSSCHKTNKVPWHSFINWHLFACVTFFLLDNTHHHHHPAIHLHVSCKITLSI